MSLSADLKQKIKEAFLKLEDERNKRERMRRASALVVHKVHIGASDADGNVRMYVPDSDGKLIYVQRYEDGRVFTFPIEDLPESKLIALRFGFPVVVSDDDRVVGVWGDFGILIEST